jgi:hypothetical protein
MCSQGASYQIADNANVVAVDEDGRPSAIAGYHLIVLTERPEFYNPLGYYLIERTAL